MLTFITKKMLYGLLVLAGVIVVVFFLFVGFGDPVRLVLGQTGDSATIKNIRKELALDQPKWKQFLLYVNDVSPLAVHSKEEIQSKQLHGIFIGGDIKLAIKWPYLRRSYQTKKSVTEVLMEALPGTMLLAFTAMLISTIFGIGLGVLAAVKQNTVWDTSAIFASVLGISAPSFFVGIILAYVFGFVLSNYTGLHMIGSLYEVDPFNGRQLQLRNLILPAVTLGIRPLAIITQLTRSAMLDVLDQDYIRTAYAKGLRRKTVIWKHALRNALNPVITAITGWFAELLAGAFFVEYIFGWKGIGKVTVDALEKLDFPVVMGSVLLTATFFVLVNILADIFYSIVDPRVKLD
ncbi:ABC transporter permease [Danxiaibacter flavus]|uniref:ABC transporter permease n=1 Tax=Danxiaibacter flavus TaxID=3049108 RepID=A0ABV3ZQP9_9BACT|nr:ABC transporter permease [Chitinophagaceae bacterium DXS]